MHLTTLIRSARERFSAPTDSDFKAPARKAFPQPPCRPTVSQFLENPMKHELFSPSPLAAETHLGAIDAIDIIFRDPSVQHAAGTCAANRSRLMEIAGFKSEISSAIESTVAKDEDLDIGNVTAAMVAEVLRQRSEEIEAAIDECRADHAAHQAKSRARMLRHEPLRVAVSQRLTNLTAERDHLIAADDAAHRANALGISGASRYAVLRSAGLSDSQIEATEPTALSPEILTERRRARLAKIGPEISALRAFSASPDFDAGLLAGLGFDALIMARDGAEVPA